MNKKLKIFFFLLCMSASLPAQLIWDTTHLARVKQFLNEPYYAQAYNYLQEEAKQLLTCEPLSVMDKTGIPASGDKHDYMSLARYYWPDPSKEDGLPYISKDGLSNPELNLYDRNPFGKTCNRINTLTLAWYFGDDESYARKAVELIRVWFLNPATKMNPNLNYAQIAKGHDNDRGRSYGVLDAYSLVQTVDAFLLLEKSSSFTKKDQKQLKAWVEKLRDWIMKSDLGQKERSGGNNHGVACDAMLASFSLYVGDETTAKAILSEVPSRRIDKQIEPDGKQPQELRRTLAFHYSIYNLGFFTDLCLLAHNVGLHLENYQSADGRSIYGALDFLIPYFGKERSAWPYQQLNGWNEKQEELARLLYKFGRYMKDAPKSYIAEYEGNRVINMKSRFNILYYDAKFTDHALVDASKQLEYACREAANAKAQKDNRTNNKVVPRSIGKEGKLMMVNPNDWCSGFFSGTLWNMYQYTRDHAFRESAVSWTWPIEDAKWDKGTHDLGFMMYNSFGKAYDITGEQSYRDVVLKSARSLITRFNPVVGCIRSWDHNRDKWNYPVIVDNMMNLELLFRATQLTGDSTFWKIAVSHANTTMKNHFRPDYSSYHVIDYNPQTGEVRKKNTAQGNADDSFWSRGQGWGLYGFTMCYRYTHNTHYLQQACNIADFWLSLPLPEDGIPYWDMKLPTVDDKTPRDASAAAIIASALYELSMYVPDNKATSYLAYADKVMQSLYNNYRAPYGTNGGFLLLHSTGHKPANSEVDVPLNYADYYYLEALLRRRALSLTSPTPQCLDFEI